MSLFSHRVIESTMPVILAFLLNKFIDNKYDSAQNPEGPNKYFPFWKL